MDYETKYFELLEKLIVTDILGSSMFYDTIDSRLQDIQVTRNTSDQIISQKIEGDIVYLLSDKVGICFLIKTIFDRLKFPKKLFVLESEALRLQFEKYNPEDVNFISDKSRIESNKIALIYIDKYEDLEYYYKFVTVGGFIIIQNCNIDKVNEFCVNNSISTSIIKINDNTFIWQKSMICLFEETVGGFFESCTQILQILILNSFPLYLDTRNVFNQFKSSDEIDKDVWLNYFKSNSKTVKPFEPELCTELIKNLSECNLKDIPFYLLYPVIDNYFNISDEIIYIVDSFQKQYNIDYENTCVLLHQDIEQKTDSDSSNNFFLLQKAKEIRIESPNINLLLQTNDVTFINEVNAFAPDNMVIQFDSSSSINNHLALGIILSKCKHIITGHSNLSTLWILLFRGNMTNVY
jgi:hypothetical protein